MADETKNDAAGGVSDADGRAGYSFVLPVLGAVLLVAPVYFIGRWIWVSEQAATHPERLALFLAVLPETLQNPREVTVVALVLAVAALVAGLLARWMLKGIWHLVSGAVIVAAAVVVVWLGFSLM